MIRLPKRLIVWLVASLLIASCDTDGKSVAEQDTGWFMEPADFEVGECNEDGRLVFWEIDAFDHMEPFVLYEDYGVMLMNGGGEDDPVPLYLLAIQKTKEVVTIRDLGELMELLSKIPDGSAIGCYGTCTVPRTWGLPDELVADYHAAISALESAHQIENWAVCYCPNRN